MDAEEGGRCEKVVKEKVARQGRTGFRGFLNERAARYGRSEKLSGKFKSRVALSDVTCSLKLGFQWFSQ